MKVRKGLMTAFMFGAGVAHLVIVRPVAVHAEEVAGFESFTFHSVKPPKGKGPRILVRSVGSRPRLVPLKNKKPVNNKKKSALKKQNSTEEVCEIDWKLT